MFWDLPEIGSAGKSYMASWKLITAC